MLRLLAIAFLTLTGAVSFGFTPQEKEADAAAVEAVRKATAKAEVHVVTQHTNATDNLTHGYIKDWAALIAGLRADKGPGAHVRGHLPKKYQETVLDKDIVSLFQTPRSELDGERLTKVSELQGNTSLLLMQLVNDDNFYTEEAFQGVKLDDGLKALVALGTKRTTRQTALMNWELLRATFPNTISDPHPFRTIQVQVRAGTDVVLVLSCYNNCLWKVDILPGGKVVGVVLCGYHGQEIEIHDNPLKAPVVYRARYRPDGTDRHGEGDYFRADGRNAKQRGAGNDFQPQAEKVSEKGGEKFVTELKKITGKDFVSFQFNPEPGPKDGPFAVPPKEKK